MREIAIGAKYLVNENHFKSSRAPNFFLIPLDRLTNDHRGTRDLSNRSHLPSRPQFLESGATDQNLALRCSGEAPASWVDLI